MYKTQKMLGIIFAIQEFSGRSLKMLDCVRSVEDKRLDEIIEFLKEIANALDTSEEFVDDFSFEAKKLAKGIRSGLRNSGVKLDT